MDNPTHASDALNAALNALRDPVRGVSVRNRKWKFSSYPNCFVGKEAVDVLVNCGDPRFATRPSAVAAGTALIRAGHIRHVTNDHQFKDSVLFYVFAADSPQSPQPSTPHFYTPSPNAAQSPHFKRDSLGSSLPLNNSFSTSTAPFNVIPSVFIYDTAAATEEGAAANDILLYCHPQCSEGDMAPLFVLGAIAALRNFAETATQPAEKEFEGSEVIENVMVLTLEESQLAVHDAGSYAVAVGGPRETAATALVKMVKHIHQCIRFLYGDVSDVRSECSDRGGGAKEFREAMSGVGDHVLPLLRLLRAGPVRAWCPMPWLHLECLRHGDALYGDAVHLANTLHRQPHKFQQPPHLGVLITLGDTIVYSDLPKQVARYAHVHSLHIRRVPFYAPAFAALRKRARVVLSLAADMQVPPCLRNDGEDGDSQRSVTPAVVDRRVVYIRRAHMKSMRDRAKFTEEKRKSEADANNVEVADEESDVVCEGDCGDVCVCGVPPGTRMGSGEGDDATVACGLYTLALGDATVCIIMELRALYNVDHTHRVYSNTHDLLEGLERSLLVACTSHTAATYGSHLTNASPLSELHTHTHVSSNAEHHAGLILTPQRTLSLGASAGGGSINCVCTQGECMWSETACIWWDAQRDETRVVGGNLDQDLVLDAEAAHEVFSEDSEVLQVLVRHPTSVTVSARRGDTYFHYRPSMQTKSRARWPKDVNEVAGGGIAAAAIGNLKF